MAGQRDSALTGCHAAVEPTNPCLPGTGTERASGAMWLLSAVVRRPAFRRQSLVTMVESANPWKGDDLARFGALDRPGDRAVLTRG